MPATITLNRYASPEPIITVTGTPGTEGSTDTTTVTIQELTDAIADYIDEPGNTDLPAVVFTEGLTGLSGVKFTGITMQVLGPWRIKFDDEGAEHLGIITGGNLKPTNGDGQPAVAPAANVFYTIEQDTAAAAIQTGSGLSAAEQAQLDRAEFLFKVFLNKAITTDIGGGAKRIDFHDDDQSTIIDSVTISADGKVRTNP